VERTLKTAPRGAVFCRLTTDTETYAVILSTNHLVMDVLCRIYESVSGLPEHRINAPKQQKFVKLRNMAILEHSIFFYPKLYRSAFQRLSVDLPITYSRARLTRPSRQRVPTPLDKSDVGRDGQPAPPAKHQRPDEPRKPLKVSFRRTHIGHSSADLVKTTHGIY
jgi:hypothetical protein